MYGEQSKWLIAIPGPKSIHFSPTQFTFLDEGVFLAKHINLLEMCFLKFSIGSILSISDFILMKKMVQVAF